MSKSERLRKQLVNHLRASKVLRSEAVAAAFIAVPREKFVPEAARSDGLDAIYKDVPVPTKRDSRGLAVSSSSQPAIMAQMLELLDVEPGHRILEVGTGTGYNAALLSRIVGARGRVVSVELDREIAGLARTRLAAGSHRVHVVVGDGRSGFNKAAPFDRIIATASAAEVPAAWLNQLHAGGILVAPLRLGGVAQVVAALRHTGSSLVSTAVVCGGFMGLRSASTDEAAVDEISQANVAWRVGDERAYRSASGPAIAHMSPAARYRLLANLCQQPRSSRAKAVNPMAFGPFLSVAARASVVTVSFGQLGWANGIALRDGRGWAAVDAAGGSTRLLSAGERGEDARVRLRTLLDAFHRNGGNVCRPPGAWDHLSASDMGPGPGLCSFGIGMMSGRVPVGQGRRRRRAAGGGSSLVSPGFWRRR